MTAVESLLAQNLIRPIEVTDTVVFGVGIVGEADGGAVFRLTSFELRQKNQFLNSQANM